MPVTSVARSVSSPAAQPAWAPTRVEPAYGALEGLSVVLPCFNEAANVRAAIGEAITAAARCTRDYEVIVVDDGSSDETAAIAGRCADVDGHVRVIVHAHNRGYGDALRSGIAAASMPWVFITDADLQFDLGELEVMLPAAEHADLLVGWRVQRRDPRNRRVNAAAWNWLMRRTFGLQVRDVDCAFKLARRDLLIQCDLTSSGAMISTELLVKSVAAGARLEEFAIHHRPRLAGTPSGANPRVVLRAFKELLAMRRSLQQLAEAPAAG